MLREELPYHTIIQQAPSLFIVTIVLQQACRGALCPGNYCHLPDMATIDNRICLCIPLIKEKKKKRRTEKKGGMGIFEFKGLICSFKKYTD